jgi:ATP-dependent Clp protease ATP-binding subunit ClpC
MYERFTTRARKVLQLANVEATRFGYEYIGTEHILLALVKEGSGVAAEVLKKLDIGLSKISLEVKRVAQSRSYSAALGERAQTPRAKKVIEYAIAEARGLGHNYVGSEHLLLGLLCEKEGEAALLLSNMGVRLESVREWTLRILNESKARQDAVAEVVTKPSPAPEKNNHPLVQQLEQLLAEFNHQKEWCVAKQQFEEAAQLRDESVAFRQIMDRITEMLKQNPNLGNPEQGHNS